MYTVYSFACKYPFSSAKTVAPLPRGSTEIVAMHTITSGNMTFEGLIFNSSQLAARVGAIIPNTTIELWINWHRIMVINT